MENTEASESMSYSCNGYYSLCTDVSDASAPRPSLKSVDSHTSLNTTDTTRVFADDEGLLFEGSKLLYTVLLHL